MDNLMQPNYAYFPVTPETNLSYFPVFLVPNAAYPSTPKDMHPPLASSYLALPPTFSSSNALPTPMVSLSTGGPMNLNSLMKESESSTKKSLKRMKTAKIRRPCNSFFLYLRDKQIEFEHILKEKPRQNMTKIVGEMWKKETEELRSIYKAMADEIKLVHLEHYPGYKYQPEKKLKKR